MPSPDHRKLLVWQRAVDLAVMTHLLVEEFSLANRIAYGAQLQRAAVSVAANIAEGAARQHLNELIQHLSIARGSLAELQTHRVIIGRLNLVAVERVTPMDEVIDHVARMLSRMIQKLAAKRGK